jgi:hypothetical protein
MHDIRARVGEEWEVRVYLEESPIVMVSSQPLPFDAAVIFACEEYEDNLGIEKIVLKRRK